MSTPKWKKRARQEEHAKKKAEIERAKLFATKPAPQEFRPYVPEPTYRRETPNYPSLITKGEIATGKTESKQYTGDYIVGIATMHKSNLVPVGRGTDPTDYATMRRN